MHVTMRSLGPLIRPRSNQRIGEMTKAATWNGRTVVRSPQGQTLPECPISTADGVKAIDVGETGKNLWRGVGSRASCWCARLLRSGAGRWSMSPPKPIN